MVAWQIQYSMVCLYPSNRQHDIYVLIRTIVRQYVLKCKGVLKREGLLAPPPQNLVTYAQVDTSWKVADADWFSVCNRVAMV